MITLMSLLDLDTIDFKKSTPLSEKLLAEIPSFRSFLCIVSDESSIIVFIEIHLVYRQIVDLFYVHSLGCKVIEQLRTFSRKR